jgi:hypothetical protein
VRFIYTSLIYFTVALGLATIWSLGQQGQAEAELARVQHLGLPQDSIAVAARAAAAMFPDEPYCPTSDSPATRPWFELTTADLPTPLSDLTTSN